MATQPLLGWIPPRDRTNEQNDAHARALGRMRQFTLPFAPPPVGTKVILTGAFKKPEVIADIGFEFTGFRQKTGSCVGVSAGNWIACLAAIQRSISPTPTKAFVPFWPYIYGRTRFNEGDRGQGEGAIDSSAGDTVASDGYFDMTQPNLPVFDHSDGLAITAHQEMQWSDGGSSLVTNFLPLGRQHVGAKAPVNSADDVAAAILNGYPVLDGDDNYVGGGSIKGSGADAYAVGHYDGRGGHSTGLIAYWAHPTDGDLFGYWNQWAGGTYPTDPGGLGRCMVWLPRSEIDKHFRSGGGNKGESIALSHADWFPAQIDAIVNCFV